MEILLVIIFILGYSLIAAENSIRIDKAAFALLTGIVCWALLIGFDHEPASVVSKISESVGDIAAILFFLIGAMTIVELIDLHNGFDLIVRIVSTRNQRTLLWIISLITFFLSPLLDNLTVTIVMVSILQKILPRGTNRLYFASAIVIAANAGGAWSPIGDVTTTMLWIGGQLTAGDIISELFFSSLVSLLVPLFILTFFIKKTELTRDLSFQEQGNEMEKRIIFFSGMLFLLMVPLIKAVFHLPPFMSMLFVLGIFWIISEVLHKKKSREVRSHLSVTNAMQRIDFPSIIFFLGILLAISALEHAHVLQNLSRYLSSVMNYKAVAVTLGFLSAIIDNVPLVAGAMGMYPLEVFPQNHHFWSMIAYASGTGGSILIIGSAAGVVAMGMENIAFFWYLRRISWIALLSYLAGVVLLVL